MTEKKTSKNIWLHIMGLLIIAELVVEVSTISEYNLISNIIGLIPLLFIALYGFWFYKKPHGNMLKYAMLIFAASQILIYLYDVRDYYAFAIYAIAIFAFCILIYVAGRLNRIERNKYLLPLSFIIQFVCVFCCTVSYFDQFSFAYICAWFDAPISTLTLMIAYFVRYKAHREAGLQDAPKK